MAAPSEGFWQRRGLFGLYELLQSWWRHRISFLLSLSITLFALSIYYLVFLQKKGPRFFNSPSVWNSTRSIPASVIVPRDSRTPTRASPS